MKANRKRVGFRVVTALILLALFSGWRPAETQAFLTCATSAAVPPSTRWEGLAEKVGDFLLVCNGGTPGVPLTVNFQIFLNTPVTSNLLDPNNPSLTDALLLVNDPAPALQVLGANVFRGIKGVAENTIIWPGVSFAPDTAGNVTFRITNLRAHANALAPPDTLPSQIIAFLSITPSSSLPINNPQQITGFVLHGLNFFVSEAPGSLNLNFRENFSTAFMKKIEVDANGVPIAQNIPGTNFSTESGFTTSFSRTDMTGAADTGTRLVARFKNLPVGTALSVPLSVLSNNSALTARLMTRVEPDFSGGVRASSGVLPICQQSAQAVYEITGAAGVTGSFAIDTFTIPVTISGAGFSGAVVSGNLGPISTVSTMTLEAPEPRFVDRAAEPFPTPSCAYLPLTIK